MFRLDSLLVLQLLWRPEHIYLSGALLSLDIALALSVTDVGEQLDLDRLAAVLETLERVELEHVRVAQPCGVGAEDFVLLVRGDAGVVGVLDAAAAVAMKDGGSESVSLRDLGRDLAIVVADTVEDFRDHLPQLV